MKFGANETIIIRQGKKFVIGKAVGKTTIIPQGSEESVRFDADDLVAIVAPVTGAKVFGCTVLPDHGFIKVGRFEIKKHANLDEDTEKLFSDVFKDVLKAFKVAGINGGQQAITYATVMPPANTFASYKTKWLKDHWEDSFTISAETEYYKEAMTVVLATNVWHHMLTPQLRAQWIALYDRIRAVHKTNEGDLTALLEAYLEMDEPKISGVKDICQMDNCDLIIKSILSSIRSNHKISPDELDMLAIYESETVGKIWPKATSYATEKASFPSYATKDAKNMFAFALYQNFFGKIPESLSKAVRITLKKIAIKE